MLLLMPTEMGRGWAIDVAAWVGEEEEEGALLLVLVFALLVLVLLMIDMRRARYWYACSYDRKTIVSLSSAYITLALSPILA